jgi:hypothetical protein
MFLSKSPLSCPPSGVRPAEKFRVIKGFFVLDMGLLLDQLRPGSVG